MHKIFKNKAQEVQYPLRNMYNQLTSGKQALSTCKFDMHFLLKQIYKYNTE